MQAKQPTKANKQLEIATHCTVASHHWLAPFVPEQAPGTLPIAMLGTRVACSRHLFHTRKAP